MNLQEKLDEALVKLLPLETELGIYQLKRKTIETPGGLEIQKITARAKRISDKESTGWGTPRAKDRAGADSRSKNHKGRLEDMVMGSTGYIAEMESTDPSQKESSRSSKQLNPALPRWLMGFPEEWCRAAIMSQRQKP